MARNEGVGAEAVGDRQGLVKEALLQIRDLRSRLEVSESRFSAPIAVVGLGCRFPGAADPAAFWDLLRDGRNAVGEIPRDRWNVDDYFDADPDAPGRMYTRHGGFIEAPDRFDPHVFGISPREAVSMDPQQRLVLEVSWEALEDAAIAPDSLTGSATGVFLGISSSDYARIVFGDPASIDLYASLGVSFSVAAGRLSYLLGLQGPSLAVDTACSSSLVAIHLACQSLRTGEVGLALAGGVNLMLLPELNINFCRAGMLAADGKCKTFDAAADGYVRGEGCGVLVLKRLEDALADGDRVRAVIRGSAVNQDGRSSGLTAPNGPSQEAVIRSAIANAGIAPADVDYVEAHGTGTSLGDPIELHALGAALTPDRPSDRPLVVGSVKTNLGHLEAAAGVAGVIKLVLALEHQEIPRQLHFERPNPHVDWARWPLEVASSARPWPSGTRRRLAGVSSFGFSGTNAHVVVEEAPTRAESAVLARPWHCLVVSGRTPTALASGARRLAAHLRTHPGLALADVARSANSGRARLPERAALVAANTADAAEELSRIADGKGSPASFRGRAVPGDGPELVFLFTGQGAQYGGMARQLFDSEPVVRAALERCDAVLRGELDRPLLDLIFDPGERTLESMAYAQPALFAVEYALSELWRSWGVKPAAVLGHSAGELVAACVAGVMNVEDGLRLIAARGRLMQSLPPGGAMATVYAEAGAVEEAIAGQGGGLTLAAINGPAHVVVSGEAERVERLLAGFEARGITGKRLRISNAYHSPLVEPILDEFEACAAKLSYGAPEVDLISNLTGRALGAGEVGPAYWREHMRKPVLFLQSLRVLERPEYRVFLEVGPGSTLLGIAQEAIDAEGRLWLPTIRRSRDEWQQVLETAAALHVIGVPIDWAAVDRPFASRKVALPTYPFERERYWPTVRTSPSAPSRATAWDAARRAGDDQAGQAPLDLPLDDFPAIWAAFARLTTAYQIGVLRQIGAFSSPGESWSAEALCPRFGIGAAHVPLLRRWLAHLAQEGILRAEGDSYVSDRELPEPETSKVEAETAPVLARYPEFNAYVTSCASRVAAVLTGQEGALETIFPGGSFSLAAGLYETSSVSRYLNAIVRAVVLAAVRVRPSGEVRVLEVGGGTGGTTSAVLEALPAERTVYLFTDVSEFFLSQAQEKFAAYPFVRYGLLDMEKDPAEQGQAPGSFDVIVAANVLHATRDLRATLARTRSLLAPGGLLVLSETTIHHRVFDITTGLIEGWEVFADDVRGDNPLLSTEQWLRVLAEAGFEHVAALPGLGGPVDAIGNRVILAAAPLLGLRAATLGEALPSAAVVAAESRPKSAVGSVRGELAEALPSERAALLGAHVRRRVMEILRLDEQHTPSLQDRLMQLGFDSLMAVQLRNRLGKDLGLSRRLPATLVFDHPSCEAIATFLGQRLQAEMDTEAEPPSPASPVRGAAPSPPPAAAAAASALAGATEAEAEALLLKKLESLEGRNR